MGVKYHHTKFEQETQRWRPEHLSQVADLSFKNCSVGPKTAIFRPKKAWNTFKTAKQRETVGTLHVRLDFPVSTSSLRPSNPTINRKRPKKAPRSCKCRQPQTKNRPYLWLHGSKFDSEGTYSTRHPPTFCGFHPSELPKRTPRPPYLGPVGCGKLQAQTQTGGCPNGSTGSSRGKKMTFLKNDPRPCATLKHVFLDRFELVVAHFGPPKCLENGLFWDQKWVKNGSKMHFSKPHPRPFGVHKRVK